MSVYTDEQQRAIWQSAEDLKDTFGVSQVLSDHSGIGDHLGCSEVESLAGLFFALGLEELGLDLLMQHCESDDEDEGDAEDHWKYKTAVQAYEGEFPYMPYEQRVALAREILR